MSPSGHLKSNQFLDLISKFSKLSQSMACIIIPLFFSVIPTILSPELAYNRKQYWPADEDPNQQKKVFFPKFCIVRPVTFFGYRVLINSSPVNSLNQEQPKDHQHY